MIEYTVKVCEYKTEWYLNGKLHRENADDTKEWWINGLKHHENDSVINK